LGGKPILRISMTDTFASGSDAPGGRSSETTGQPADVTGTLAELEHKLRELERELTSIGRRREVTDAAPAPDEAAAGAELSRSSGRLVDEAIEPVSPIEFSSPAPQPTRPPEPREAPRPVAEPEPIDQSLESVQTSERTRPSDAQLASLAELRRFRDRLERFARELATEYDALLSRVMAGLTAAPASAASASAPHPTTPASSTASPARPVPATPSPVPPNPVAPSSMTPGPPAPSPMTPSPATPSPMTQSPAAPSPMTPGPATPAPEVLAAQSRENALFEGRVELGVGPFYDIASLGAFEQRLANVPGVSEASVRRFEASHAVVDVRLAAPVALVRELRHAAASDFSVREVAGGRILLTFDES
jgi:hypothetical protein